MEWGVVVMSGKVRRYVEKFSKNVEGKEKTPKI